MANVGSYILSTAQDRESRDITPKDAAPRLLKVIADKVVNAKKDSCSFGELLSVTGFPETTVSGGLKLLQDSGMIEEAGDGYRLTATGERTHLLVAS